MNLLLKRDFFTPESTTGVLSIDGVFQCFVLEDVDRKLETGGAKIHGLTAIPRGIYPLTITYSPRFQKPLPLLSGVSGFDGIRIHCGNTDADTEGCLLVGNARWLNKVGGSRIAFDALFTKIKAALDRKEKVTIEIK
ncbi:DUF5675 family protein [Iodobacter sp. CM08]|uniref:DUF5675 family protein n=1 Tax=Iodobacter sp. CM08 TaxID=3085902 RepID=UPI0029826D6A|nr:DUF5675 family protein [Iodobacter sp. CM08]MDW5417826.1 DUF5675 family protein [Iodobacter sp. CM08]